MPPPIIVIGFNRPGYLDRVLGSLIAQSGCDLASRKIAFFQDGAINDLSGIRYATDEELISAAAVFRRHFPAAPIFTSPRNIGICANFQRAENYAFNELDAETAYFFEDDMVLAPQYISAMDQIWNIVRDIDKIAYFAAYGDRFSTATVQRVRVRAVIPMRHNWAFALKRNHWREMTAFLKPYFDIVNARDYHERDDNAVKRWYQSLGHAHEATSQDGAKALVTNLLGRFRLLTVASFARYIGEVGVHTRPDLFHKEGFAEAETYDGLLQGIDVPANLDQLIADERIIYSKLWGSLGRIRQPNPEPLASRSEVISAYRLFLGREPENEGVIKARLGVPVSDLIDLFCRSSEYLRRIGRSD